MRSTAFLLLIPALLFSAARADDLVTRDGTVYKNYKVLSHDTGFVTIMYADGGGKIPLSQLPDDLQKKYGYDPAAAAAAAQAAAEQERKDRKAIQDEQLAHQRAMEAPPPDAQAAPAVAPNVAPTPAAAAAAAPPAAAPADTAASGTTTLPKGGLTWPEIEQVSTKIVKLEEELGDLRESIGEAKATAVDSAKLSDDQATLAGLNSQYQLQLQYLENQQIPGPILSDTEIQARKDELAAILDAIDDVGHVSSAMTRTTRIEKTERANVLKLELKYANVPAVAIGASPARNLHTWDEAKSMSDRRVALFDEIADLMHSGNAYRVQIDADHDEDVDLVKKQAEFEAQLEGHLVKGPQMSDADLDALKTQINDTYQEHDMLLRNNSSGQASLHTIFADSQTLWLLNLQRKYAND